MILTGLQYKQFTEALLDAFQSQQRLTELVKFQFGKNLNVIAMGGDLKEIVFKLIQAAEAEGWTDKLIAGTRESNPRNSKLFAFAQEFNLAVSTPAELSARGALERLIKKTNSLTEVK